MSPAEARSVGDRQPPDPRRNPVALVAAVTDAIAARERSSVRAAAVIVAAASIVLGLVAGAVPPLAFLGRLPWWLPPALIAAAAAVLVAFMPTLLLPRALVDAWVTLTHLALAGRRRWKMEGEPFPEASEVDGWLRRHSGPEDALRRSEVLAAHGRLAEVEVPDEDGMDPSQRFLRGQVAWFAAFARGDDAGARAERATLDALLAQMPEGPDRAESAAALRGIDALRALAAGSDWISPLAAARRDLGSTANGLLLRWFVLPRLRYYGRISVAIFVGVVLINLLLESALD